jgi:uncharacterized membrane protein
LALHIACGAVALLTLAVPFLAVWGGKLHKRVGWVFASAMGGVSLSAWALAAFRLNDGDLTNDADAIFLSHVGLLSGASVWMGVRAVRLKRHITARHWSDVAWPGALALSSLGLFSSGIVRGDVLWIVFSLLGAGAATTLLRYLLGATNDENEWLAQHLGSMGTGAISAVTAFFVVNVENWGLGDYALVFWIAPGIVGGTGLSLLGRRVQEYGLRKPPRSPAAERRASPHRS